MRFKSSSKAKLIYLVMKSRQDHDTSINRRNCRQNQLTRFCFGSLLNRQDAECKEPALQLT